jgi:hypothetical protein
MFIGEEMTVQVKNLQNITPIVVEHVYWRGNNGTG